jgi:hypothetical protein
MMQHDGILPNFMILGAQKCGTTALWNTLCQNPDIGNTEKEKQFFSNDIYFSKGINFYSCKFNGQKHKKLNGDADPNYLWLPCVPERVKKHLPNCKFIVLLRNPVDRAYSQFQHNARARRIRNKSFEEVLKWEQNEKGIYHTYLSRSRYAEQLERWFDLFAREQFYIQSFEEFCRDGHNTIREVETFLDATNTKLVPPGQLSTYKEMRHEIRERLSEYFREYNYALYEMIGVNFGWGQS